MSEIKQNLKKLYRIFKSTKFPLYNGLQLEKGKVNRNIFLKYKYQPINKEISLKDNIYFTSRLFKSKKFIPKRNLQSGIFEIKSLDRNHPDFQIIENNKAKLKSHNILNNSHNSDLYRVGTKILGSQFVELNKKNNNLLKIFNDRDDFNYRILLERMKKKKRIAFLNYKNTHYNSYKSFFEKKDFKKFPPFKNKLLKHYFEINKEDN